MAISKVAQLDLDNTFDKQVGLAAPQGTAPLSVTSTTAVTNLNADLLDGKHLSEIMASIPTVPNASTSAAGIVQLNNTLTSTSTTQALTAAQGKALNDKFASYRPTSWTPTKADVGLGSVNNWGASTAINSTSTTTYATASAVKQAYDRAEAAFQSASNGKVSVANAITAKGVSTSTTAEFATMASNIGKIETGINSATCSTINIVKQSSTYDTGGPSYVHYPYITALRGTYGSGQYNYYMSGDSIEIGTAWNSDNFTGTTIPTAEFGKLYTYTNGDVNYAVSYLDGVVKLYRINGAFKYTYTTSITMNANLSYIKRAFFVAPDGNLYGCISNLSGTTKVIKLTAGNALSTKDIAFTSYSAARTYCCFANGSIIIGCNTAANTTTLKKINASSLNEETTVNITNTNTSNFRLTSDGTYVYFDSINTLFCYNSSLVSQWSVGLPNSSTNEAEFVINGINLFFMRYSGEDDSGNRACTYHIYDLKRRTYIKQNAKIISYYNNYPKITFQAVRNSNNLIGQFFDRYSYQLIVSGGR